MKKILRRASWALLWTVSALLLGAAAVAVAPARLVPPLAKAAAGLAGVPLRIGGMSGGFRDGFELRDVSVGLPAADLTASRLELDVRWRRLAKREFHVERLVLVRPVVRAREGSPEEPAPPQEPGGSAWKFSADHVRVEQGVVVLGERAVRGIDVRAAYPRGRLVVTRARAVFEDSEIRARGSVAPAVPKAWAAVSARGPLSADVRLRGEGGRWSAAGRARFRGATASVSADAAADVWKARAVFGGVDPAWLGAGFVKGPLSGRVSAEGDGLNWPPESAGARVRLEAPEQGLSVRGDLRADRLQWDARLEGDVSGRVRGTWKTDGSGAAANWDLKARGPILARLIAGGSEAVSTSGRAEGVRRPSGWEVRGRDLRFSAGPNLDFEGEFALLGKTLVVPRLVWRTPGGELVLRGTVPATTGGKGRLPDFDFSLQGRSVSWEFLKHWLGQAEIEGSALDADLRLAHRKGVFRPAGTLNVRASRIKGTAAGLDLRDFSLRFVAEPGAVRITEGTALTKKGRVTLAGSFNARGPDISVTADRLAFRAPGEVKGSVSGAAALKGRWAALAITGDVDVLEADYRPAKKKKGKKEKGWKRKPPVKKAAAARGRPGLSDGAAPPGPLTVDLRIRCDRDAWYKDGSNYIEMKGDLRVRKDRWEPVRLVGSIETLRGQYGYYGRTFVIQEGKLRFSGETPIDPALRVRAVYLEETSGTKVFLDVGGTASRPTLALSSLPPLEEQDILSVLAFGRPLDQSGHGPGGSEAAQSLVANYLLQQTRNVPLVRQLDLDILQVQRSAEGGTSLTVGRYLSRDLFVSYDQTLGETGQRRLNAEYTFTPRWSLFGRRSDGSHYIIDLLFKYGVR